MKNAGAIIFRSMILLLIGTAIGFYLADNNLSGNGLNFSLKSNNKINSVLRLVKDNYVDSVNEDSLEGVAVNNVLQTLDPHSLYLQPQRAQSINENLDGGFNGVGLEYQILRDTLVVTQVYSGGPASTAGLLPGDKIISVNEKKFSGTKLTAKKVDQTLKGDSLTQISMLVLTANNSTLKTYRIQRGHVDLSSLDAAYMINPETGYIKISKFASTTDADFRDALTKLKARGLKKLVLDIRENGGGYLSAATSL
uniref:S41 family peptidase n=1 Tax=uncultured Mucilaginibacter sp. TaxID=797541 RepID=UPI0025E266B0